MWLRVSPGGTGVQAAAAADARVCVQDRLQLLGADSRRRARLDTARTRRLFETAVQTALRVQFHRPAIELAANRNHLGQIHAQPPVPLSLRNILQIRTVSIHTQDAPDARITAGASCNSMTKGRIAEVRRQQYREKHDSLAGEFPTPIFFLGGGDCHDQDHILQAGTRCVFVTPSPAHPVILSSLIVGRDSPLAPLQRRGNACVVLLDFGSAFERHTGVEHIDQPNLGDAGAQRIAVGQ